MQIDRAAIFLEALEELDVVVGRSTRYANDTGTCLWCANGTLVMVPDDANTQWFCQAKGSEELQARLAALIEPRLQAAAEERARLDRMLEAQHEAMSPAQRQLVALGEELRREGYEAALVQARAMFAEIMRGKFGPLPQVVEQRIANAQFYELERWSGRLFTLPRAILVVA